MGLLESDVSISVGAVGAGDSFRMAELEDGALAMAPALLVADEEAAPPLAANSFFQRATRRAHVS